MPINLSSREAIAALDVSNMAGSVESLAQQIEHAWQDTRSLTFTPQAEIRSVIVAGMGGSALGADVIRHVFKDQLAVPLEIARDYTLPASVGKHTLVILASYSGTTEETLSCAQQAQTAGAQLMVISAGGALIELAEKHNLTHYTIVPTHNPSGQPRAAIGYAITGTIALLNSAGLISVSKTDVDTVLQTVRATTEECSIENPEEGNPAKLLAFNMVDLRPVIVVADFLEGAGHVAANTTNENAKAFADYKVLPELNHHLLEGLQFPKTNTSTHTFVFVMSILYHERNRTRAELTQELIDEMGIPTVQLPLKGTTKLAQAFELITLFAFASFYLSLLENINPTPIPYVDKFKEALSTRNS
jgi:glucose/mannose-6-phosphate isomerase